MATYFGEVVALSSRAVTDEDDDDHSSSQFIAVTLDYIQPEFDDSVKENDGTETVVFVIGDTASAFCKSYLLTDEFQNVADIKARFLGDAEPERLGQLFRSKLQPCVTICEIREDINEEYYFRLAQTVCNMCFSSVRDDNCTVRSVILTSRHTSAYKHCVEDALEEPFIKCLATSQYMNTYPTLNADYIFPPNIITGIPAALMSFCEVAQKKAILYVCYSHSFDSCAAKSFENILGNPLISGMEVRKDSGKKLETLFNLRRQMVSNLYT